MSALYSIYVLEAISHHIEQENDFHGLQFMRQPRVIINRFLPVCKLDVTKLYLRPLRAENLIKNSLNNGYS